MPAFSPFAGIRYDATRASLADLTAPPYDVIDDEQRARLAARHPHNAVHIDLPVDADGVDRYGVAASLLQQWRADGILVDDAAPVFYGYRMSFTDPAGRARHTTGVIGAVELSRPGDGDILPHEHTTPKAKSDRLQMLRSCRANLSCIWGLTPAAGLTALLGDPGDDDPTWTDDDGVEHSLWIIDDSATIDAISMAVAAHPVVIADGHHRFETSVAYRDERRTADGGSAGAAEAAMIYVVELVADELTVLPIHRLLDGLPDGFDLAGALDPWFEVVEPIDLDTRTLDHMIDGGVLVLVEPGGAREMRPRDGAFDGVRDLDTSRVDAALAGVAGHELRYQHGVAEVARAVESGQAAAGILVRPASIEAISATADGGERMPPKTTFFHPKPRTGQVFRSID
ncbi:MAG: DUF1015 domain-containing protein [Acidimicrobiia bacterium]|nr:DUF1015 domain-containing protein [Acidimicrobiia bacterium]